MTNPYQAPESFQKETVSRDEAKRRLSTPAFFLIAIVTISVPLNFLGKFGEDLGILESDTENLELRERLRIEYYDEERGRAVEKAISSFSFFIGVVMAGFVVYGARSMWLLKERSYAQFAAVLVMLPCVTPLCLIGIPIGIWTLLRLRKPDIRQHFESESTTSINLDKHLSE